MNAMDWRVNLLTDKFQFVGRKNIYSKMKYMTHVLQFT